MKKKKFTILIAAAMLCSSGGVAWGQSQGAGTINSGSHLPGTSTTNCNGSDYASVVVSPADNNFGPGESGTLKPLGGGDHSTDAGTWTAGYGGANSWSWNKFNKNSGRITVGGTGTTNIVELSTNLSSNQTTYAAGANSTSSGHSYVLRNKTASVSGTQSNSWSTSDPYYSTHTSYSGCGQFSLNNIDWDGPNVAGTCNYVASWQYAFSVGSIDIPDGTGQKLTGTGGSSNYGNTYKTYIYIDGSTKNSDNLWELSQLYFLNNEWRWVNYNVKESTSSHTHYLYGKTPAITGTPHTAIHGATTYTWYDTWNGTSYSTSTPIDSDSHNYIEWTYTTGQVAVEGAIAIMGGSQVNLTGDDATLVGGKKIGVGSAATGNDAYFILPNVHYTLMVDNWFDEASFTNGGVDFGSTNNTNGSIYPAYTVSDTLGVNAVLGIYEGYNGKIFYTNGSGGTLLLGPSAQGQDKMVITTTTTTAPIVTKYFQIYSRPVKTEEHGTSYYTLNGATNVGNYGNNSVVITNAATMFAQNVGTAGWQLFAHSETNCIDYTIQTSALRVNVNDAGSVLIDAARTLKFDITNTFNASTTSSGHTTIRGGDVLFNNGVHTYAGQSSGDYWVHAKADSSFTLNGNLLKYCGDGDIIAETAAPIIVSNINGNGELKWEARRHIKTDPAVSFSAGTVANSSNVYWVSHTGNITTDYSNNNDGGVTFQNDGTGNTKWVAEGIGATAGVSGTMGNILANGGISFKNTSSGNTDWEAFNNITTNDTVLFDNTGTGNTKWWAKNGNITTNRGTHGPGFVTFTNSGASGDNVDWWAGQNILTNNVVEFTNAAATTDAYIKWWAQGNNIEMNDSVTINQNGTAPTSSLRGLANNVVPGKGALYMVALNNILTENNTTPNGVENPLLINYAATNNAPIMLWAQNKDIITDGVVHTNRAANTSDTETTFEAGRDIHFLDTVTVTDLGATPNILLHAHRDIRTNDSICDASKTAPVYFNVTKTATTNWVADRNIHTVDTVNFIYGSTTNLVKNLSLIARGGNIETDRWFNVDHDGNSRVMISAERDKSYSNAASELAALVMHGSSTVGNIGLNPRNMLNGNIFFNDSVKITRNNTANGKTGIYADYNIRTAMVNILNSLAANKNNTTVESHLGDIFLGYSVDKDNCQIPVQDAPLSYDNNIFSFTSRSTAADSLYILAGYQDQSNTGRDGGGNIYFSHIVDSTTVGGTTNTEISIPFSNEWMCGTDDSLHNRSGNGMIHYEHAGIIGGLGRCGNEANASSYIPMSQNGTAHDTAFIYRGNKGNLLVDAGTRGNIIFNTGGYLNYRDDNGAAKFITRYGDIDMRHPFNVDSMAGGLMFLASSEEIDKLDITVGRNFCNCDEMKNNVYLQDLDYKTTALGGGGVYFGADNNIKLNYGGLTNRGTKQDPFLSTNYKTNADGSVAHVGTGYRNGVCGSGLGYPDSLQYHCDLRASENQARPLMFDYSQTTDGGGVAMVASDRIDIYKDFTFRGAFNGTGMKAAPTTDGQLHGENVAGYGLYMLTQANKNNWTMNILKNGRPTCPTGCGTENCEEAYLHNTVRMTFHSNAHIVAGNTKVYIGSPVIEAYDTLEFRADSMFNTATNTLDPTPNGRITVKVDSLIVHGLFDYNAKSSQIKLTTWSGLHNDKPIIKLGYNRNRPPVTEYAYDDNGNRILCRECVVDDLDTTYVKFGDGATLDRLNVTVSDHTVLTFMTDSFDHQLLGGVQDAKIYTDTFKIRNQVKMWSDPTHIYDGKLELISEEQMFSKNYAGIYTKHLHMEPIGACDHPTSELWQLEDHALDVITTSTFGGFGILYNDVHVENEGFLAPGFASLGLAGNCYEQHAGTLTMDDLRLDGGAIINVTVGDGTPGPDGYLDMVNVKGNLTTYGSVYIHIKLRPCQHLPNMCGSINPVLKYNTATPGSLNNIFFVVDMPDKNSKAYKDYKDDWDALANMTLNMTTEGEIYICEDEFASVIVNRQVNMPSVAGVTTNPSAGIHYVQTGDNFKFTAAYTTDKPFVVRTDRYFDGVQEVLEGTKNANGEYEYTISRVASGPVNIFFGPDFVANASVDEGTAVWSHNNTIYVKVDRADIASIYSIAGQLVKRIEVPEGDTSIPMERGVYVVTLKDGSVHKVIVK